MLWKKASLPFNYVHTYIIKKIFVQSNKVKHENQQVSLFDASYSDTYIYNQYSMNMYYLACSQILNLVVSCVTSLILLNIRFPKTRVIFIETKVSLRDTVKNKSTTIFLFIFLLNVCFKYTTDSCNASDRLHQLFHKTSI